MGVLWRESGPWGAGGLACEGLFAEAPGGGVDLRGWLFAVPAVSRLRLLYAPESFEDVPWGDDGEHFHSHAKERPRWGVVHIAGPEGEEDLDLVGETTSLTYEEALELITTLREELDW